MRELWSWFRAWWSRPVYVTPPVPPSTPGYPFTR
jgi:hypothetical protein